MRQRAADIAFLIAALLGLWQGVHLYAGDEALASPMVTFAYLADQLGTARFWGHIAESGMAFAWALLYAALGGLGLGLWLGFHRFAGVVAEPILVAIYSLPKVTLYPVMLLIFGLGLPAKVAFGTLHGIIPVVIFAMNAIRNLNPVLLRTARVMRLGPQQTALHVLLPAALPEIVSGLRIGFSLTMLGVLIGEMFASKRGLGFVIINAIGLNDSRTIMAVAVLVFGFAALANGALLALDRRLHRR